MFTSPPAPSPLPLDLEKRGGAGLWSVQDGVGEKAEVADATKWLMATRCLCRRRPRPEAEKSQM
eukprot:2054726-Pyramimonas_sp.AAC.1